MDTIFGESKNYLLIDEVLQKLQLFNRSYFVSVLKL